jgi:hypothetical protein
MGVKSGALSAALALGLSSMLLSFAAPALAAPPSPPPTPPPSLQGETFTGDNPFPYADTCSTAGATGQATLRATGVAAGPYAGTFTESVTVSFASPFGQVTGLHATFTITSPTGSVTGTKDLSSLGAPSSLASCLPAPPFAPPGSPPFAAFFTDVPLTYQANITSSAGVYYTDSGTADAANAFATGPVTTAPQAFHEQFDTSNGVAAVRPQSKDDCKDGGYVHYGYKNQGQCVSDVNHN